MIQNKKFEYYTSPILNRHNFKHAYFTKSSSEQFLQLLGNYFNENSINCVSNQIHSNVIVFGSHSHKELILMQMVLLAINAVKTYGFTQLIVCQYFLQIKGQEM